MHAPIRRRFRSLFPWICCCVLLAVPRAAPGQDTALWQSISDGLRQNIALKRQELVRIRQALPGDKAALDAELADVSSRLDQILLLRGVAGETPWAARSLLMQLRELTLAVDTACGALLDMRDALSRAKQEYAVVRQIRAQNASREYADLVNEELAGPGRDFKELKGEVDAAKGEVDAALAQADALKADIETARQEEVERFIGLFTQAYFTSSGSLLRLANLAGLVDDFVQWCDGAPRFWRPVANWTLWERYLAVAAVDFLLLLGAMRLGARRWPAFAQGRWPALLWLAGGLALFAARQTVLFAANQFTSLAWVVAVAWGLVALLGGAVPLRTLFACFTATVVLDATKVPASGAGTALAGIAAAAIWRLSRSGRRLSFDLAVLAGSAVAGVLGYGPQGLAAVQALFMLHLALGVGDAVQRGLGALGGGGKGSLAGLVSPLATTLLATLYVAWVLVFLGGPGLMDYVFERKFEIGRVTVTLDAVCGLLLAFFLLRLLQAWFTRLLGLANLRGKPIDAGLAHTLGAIFSYLTWLLFLLFALRLFEVPLGALTWIASGLSVGIGFGLKDIVNNFVSGLIIMFGGAVKKGDIIQQGKNIGEVVDLSVRNTIMRTLDNTTVIIPNSSFLRGEIVNLSYQDATLRLAIPVTVAPGTKIKKVRKILVAIAKEHPGVLKKPAPEVLMNTIGRLGLEFILYVWIGNFMEKFQIQSELATAIDQQFQDNKILVAFQSVKVKYKPKGTEAMQLEAMREELRQKRGEVCGKTRRLRRVHVRRRWPVTPVARVEEE
ncbi:mechanosensitive ion channel family protein [Solidesulfovibrio sp.]|uniref:mechanosensitive ion channel family protein n=1 Tax=Solidesulfovibrio sp. TaxID=2910990 RepID=UPI002B208594|nr:mechanosensitive ion channel domain-containing protein [Solidesulfovibrio sp.]MEA4856044.1 mechanosensitive ion channel [Solidesulfovibrio sp.]